jgi:hypothetical protein
MVFVWFFVESSKGRIAHVCVKDGEKKAKNYLEKILWNRGINRSNI